MAQKKVNWYSASKDLAARVVEFGDAKLWGIIHRSQCKAKIAGLEVKIENLQELKGSMLDVDGRIDAQISEYQEQIEQAQAYCDEQIEKDAKFSYTANDTTMYKAYKNAESDKDIKDAITAWLKYYGVDAVDTKDLAMLTEAISGARRLGAGAIVRAKGKQFTSDKRTKNDVLGILYGKMTELLVAAGTVKLVSIPKDVQAMYVKTKKNNK